MRCKHNWNTCNTQRETAVNETLRFSTFWVCSECNHYKKTYGFVIKIDKNYEKEGLKK